MPVAGFTPTKTNLKCPICGKPVKGDMYKYRCSDDGCGFNISHTLAGAKLSESQVAELLSGKKIWPIDGFVSKKGKKFSALLTWDREEGIKFILDGESGTKCPDCEKNLTMNTWNYTCECGVKLPREMCGKKIPGPQIEKLLRNGKTDVIKGFKSKAGKKFDAKLRREGKGVAFEFENAKTSKK